MSTLYWINVLDNINFLPPSGINFKDMTKDESNVKVANETSSITSISDDILFLMKLYIKNLPINWAV